jgi:hypothetical protein
MKNSIEMERRNLGKDEVGPVLRVKAGLTGANQSC